MMAAGQHSMHHHMSIRSLVEGSALMLMAMMVPLIGVPLRHVLDRSLARRRVRAVILFLAGYGLPWLVAGAVLMAAAARISAQASLGLTLGVVAAIAVWQCSPAKQRCLNRCHARGPLAAFGVRADLDVLRFGLVHALWCIGACSGLMLLPMLLPHGFGHLAVMAAVTLWLLSERLSKAEKPRWRVRGPEKMLRILSWYALAWNQRFRQLQASLEARAGSF